MSTSNQLANRFREVTLNGKWVANTNLQEQLSEVSLEEAVSQVGNLNTIASLSFHINYYIAGVLNILQGGDLEIRDKFSFDLPPLKSQEDWDDLRNTLFSNSEKFASQLEQISEEQLNEVFVDERYGDYRRNIEGIIEHCYYHLGQISLIRKMVRAGDSHSHKE